MPAVPSSVRRFIHVFSRLRSGSLTALVLAFLTSLNCQSISAHGQAVDLTLQDTGKASSSWISRAGGQLSLALASGGSAVLTIPKGALLGTTHVSMSEVKLANPLKGLNQIRGIKLEPDGLEFVMPYTLDITLPAYAKAKQPIAVGYSGSGRSSYLYPSTQKGDKLTVLGDHFSGYIFSDAAEEAARVFEYAAVDLARERIAQQVGAKLREERKCQILGIGCDSEVLKGDLFCRMREDFIKPLIEQSKRPDLSCGESASITSVILGYERQLQLLGSSDEESWSAFTSHVVSSADRCRAEAIKICRQTGDPIALIRQSLVSAREMQLFGGEDTPDLSLANFVELCGSYSVKATTRQKTFIEDPSYPGDGFHSTYTIDFETPWDDGENRSLDSSIRSRFETVGLPGSTAKGDPAEASLWITEYKTELKTKELDYSKDAIAQPLEKAKVMLSFVGRNLDKPTRTSIGDKSSFETDALVEIVDPGNVKETMIICTRDNTCGPVEWADWQTQFRVAHRTLMRNNVVTFALPLRGLAPDIASKTFASPQEKFPIGGGITHVQETTDIELHFRPASTPIDPPVSRSERRPIKPGAAHQKPLKKVQCPT